MGEQQGHHDGQALFGTVPVGDHVIGRVMNQEGQALDGGGDIGTEPRVARLHLEHGTDHPPQRPVLLETGIKIIDLLAPLVHGGAVRLSGPPTGVGIMVNLGEFTRRLAIRGRGCTVYVGRQERPLAAADLTREWREQGIDRLIATVVGQHDARDDGRRALETALTIAVHFAAAGRDVLLAIEESAVARQDLTRVRAAWSHAGGHGTVTCVLLDIWGNGVPRDSADGSVDGTHLVFDAARAQRRMYPAIDPLRSTSELLHGAALAAEHLPVADRARTLLARFQELMPTVKGEGDASLSADDRAVFARGRRLELFLTQPYHVAEAFTGLPGEDVPLARTIADVAEIVAGRHDGIPERFFAYTGTLGDVLAKARAAETGE